MCEAFALTQASSGTAARKVKCKIDNGAGGSRATWTGRPERVYERGTRANQLHPSVERLPIALDANGQHDDREERDLPKLQADIDDAVPFQENAADDAQKMGERKNFAH